MGRAYWLNIINMKLEAPFREALAGLGYTLEELAEREVDAGPWSGGGLGRLAACFLDSLATMDIPAFKLRHVSTTTVSSPAHCKRLSDRAA